MLRHAGRKLSLVGLIGTFALAFSLESAAAVVALDVKRVVSAPGTPSEADKKTIDTYLGAGFFSQFVTKPGVPALDGAILPALRKDYGNMVRGVGKTPGHDYLNAKAFDFANRVIKGPPKSFSPAAKYNAMLLIADMNESDVPGAIKPNMAALGMMTKCLAIPADSQMAYLKPAALIGITRLAEEKALPPNTIAPISAALLKVLEEKDPPAGGSASAHNFMRRSAARALAAIGSPGPKNEVVTAIRSIMLDPNAKFTMRCEMAQLFYQLNIPPESKVDVQDLANLIGWQTVDICDQELLRAEEEKREPSRRIAMYALRTADAGLSGLGRSAEKNEEASKFIAKIRGKVSQLHNQLDDVSKVPDDKVAEMVVPELEAIRGLLKPKPAPEPAAPAAPTATETAAKPAN
jgi:hypothetical protein